VWLAHALTLSRIPLALALWRVWGDAAWSVALLGIAGLTDTADGRVARWAKRRGRGEPDIGGWLDPAVDKLFVAIVLAVIWAASHDLVTIALVGARELVRHARVDHLATVIALIAARELVLVPLAALYLARRRTLRGLRADRFGKTATIAQFIALCVIAVAPEHALPAAAVAGVLGLAAACHYIATTLSLRHAPPGQRIADADRDIPG
jgi:phosphatidylglycerophosphate synthase